MSKIRSLLYYITMDIKEQNINKWHFQDIAMSIFFMLGFMLLFLGICQFLSLDIDLAFYLIIFQIAFYVSMVISVFYFAIFKKSNTFEDFFGARDFFAMINRGFFVFALIILALTAIDITSEALFHVRSSDVYKGFDKELLRHLAFIGVVFAPFSEEVFFRGFLQPVFVEKFGKYLGVLCVALLFSFLHVMYISNISALLGIMTVGLILSITKEKTGSLIPCVVAHFLNNLIAAFYIN